MTHKTYFFNLVQVGVVLLAWCLEELDNPLRFENLRQMCRMTEYNFIEDSSEKNKSRTCTSKRGRINLCCVLYKKGINYGNSKSRYEVIVYVFKKEKTNFMKKLQSLV